MNRTPDESDQDYQRRVVSERYSLVQGETEEECLDDLRAAVQDVLEYRRQTAVESPGRGERLEIHENLTHYQLPATRFFPFLNVSVS